MSSNPNVITIKAYIPNIETGQYAVDLQGKLPSRDFHEADGTYEGTLNALTNEVVGTYGKIDKRLHDVEANNEITYLTIAYGGRAIVSSQYTWGDLPEQL